MELWLEEVIGTSVHVEQVAIILIIHLSSSSLSLPAFYFSTRRGGARALKFWVQEAPRCFGPHHLTLRGSMGDFKVFFGPFFQIQAFRPVLANYE